MIHPLYQDMFLTLIVQFMLDKLLIIITATSKSVTIQLLSNGVKSVLTNIPYTILSAWLRVVYELGVQNYNIQSHN